MTTKQPSVKLSSIEISAANVRRIINQAHDNTKIAALMNQEAEQSITLIPS